MDANDLTKALIANQKSERFWKNFRFFIIIAILFLIFYFFYGTYYAIAEKLKPIRRKDYVSLVRLSGLIAPDSKFSAYKVTKLLSRAFQDKNAKGVIIDINSGGGTPVQSTIIHNRILAYKKQFKKKVVVVGEDLMASGAYLIASAGDMIVVNPDTITGSIGVILSTFGFPEAIKKIGVERRVITSGDFKDRLDMFEPMSEGDKHKMQSVLNQVHQNFIRIVKKDRGSKLKASDAVLFSGDFWTGAQAISLGLADKIGDIYTVMHFVFKAKTYRDYTPSESFLTKAFGKVHFNMGLNLQKLAKEQQSFF